MKIEIVDRQPVAVACLRYTGASGEPLGRFWRCAVAPWLAEHGLIDCPRYGVALDNPMNTPPQACHYDACVELPPGLTLPEVSQATIPGGRYAVTPFKGTDAQIGAAWGAFIGQLLAGGALERDTARHAFEHYPRGATFDAKTGVFSCQLCVPVT